jgi:acetyl esterase/lipase
MSRKLALLFTLLALGASPLVAQAQEKKFEVQTESELVYGKGGDKELKLDLAMPKDAEGPFPAVVCIHGGGWHGGSRQDLAKTIEVLAGRGYVAVTIAYRLAPTFTFPAPIEDCKAAVRWLRANAKKYKVNPERIGALGYSAGGHLACLLGTSDKSDGLEGNGGNAEQSSRVQAVVSFFGPTDLTRTDWNKDVEKNVLTPFLGGTLTEKPEVYKKASPVTYVTKDDPPFLFFHGTKDPLVPLEHSKALAEKLKAAGVSADVVVMEGEGHGWGGEKLVKTLEQMVAFLDEQLKK